MEKDLTSKTDSIDHNIVDVVQRKGLHGRIRAPTAQHVHAQLHNNHTDSPT